MTRIELIDFLRNNHKHFAKMTEQNFDAWESAWEDSKYDDYPHLEISSWDSLSGEPVILD